jgi:hypothetical protein
LKLHGTLLLYKQLKATNPKGKKFGGLCVCVICFFGFWFLVFFFFPWFSGAGDENEGFMHARQVLYGSYIPSPQRKKNFVW